MNTFEFERPMLPAGYGCGECHEDIDRILEKDVSRDAAFRSAEDRAGRHMADCVECWGYYEEKRGIRSEKTFIAAGCRDAQKDIRFFLSHAGQKDPRVKVAKERAFAHMTMPTLVFRDNVVCLECWPYYKKEMKRLGIKE